MVEGKVKRLIPNNKYLKEDKLLKIMINLLELKYLVHFDLFLLLFFYFICFLLYYFIVKFYLMK